MLSPSVTRHVFLQMHICSLFCDALGICLYREDREWGGHMQRKKSCGEHEFAPDLFVQYYSK